MPMSTETMDVQMGMDGFLTRQFLHSSAIRLQRHTSHFIGHPTRLEYEPQDLHVHISVTPGFRYSTQTSVPATIRALL